jgi:hypothetical protein
MSSRIRDERRILCSNVNTKCRAIPKVGACPSGFMQSGDYCLEMDCREVKR